jgi:uncharacterized protein (TIGR03067 family)
MPRRALAMLFGLGLTLAVVPALAQDRKPEEPADDLKVLQGSWVSKDDTGESVWTFKGNDLSLATPTRKYDMTIKLDPAAKPHKTIDFHVKADSPNAAGAKAEGIYKIEGAKLVICFGSEQAGRPEAFEADMQMTFLFDLSRKKDE